ncbi:hypothetical protein BJ165DRAFT_1406944 [Panaeolus papilionaceus]|nr:hypothetical protein BJ165DRAFT_1406944 [Panaeolus papilionaceus]
MADRMADRLRLDIAVVTALRGVSFDDWLRLSMQYCFILTKRGQYDVAEEIVRHITLSDAAMKNPGILRWNGLDECYAATATTGGAAGKKNKHGDDETPAPMGGGGGTVMTSADGAPRIPTKENPSSLQYIGRFVSLRRVIKVPFPTCTPTITTLTTP